MSERSLELFENWAQSAAHGRSFLETAHIFESVRNAWHEISHAQVVEGRVILTFLGGASIDRACGAAYTVLTFSKLPVVMRFNGVEISMARVEP